MSDWIVTDGTGTTIHIPPIPEGLVTAGWLLLAAIVMVVILWVLKFAPKAKNPRQVWRGFIRWIQEHYVSGLVLTGCVLFLLVLYGYVGTLIPIVGDLLAQMREPDPTADKSQTRNIAVAIAAFAGMLAVLSTVPFRLVRAWINERTAKTQEATHITGLINTAVEGLGAEKTVSRIGRVLRFKDGENGKVQTKIEWESEGESSELPEGLIGEPGDWESFNVTKPNLEVRIGAILTLERIARDNPEDHIRVMDILCAYIRENSKAEDAEDHPFGDWPEYPEKATADEFEERQKKFDLRQEELRKWANDLQPVRIDIQKALEVIGNRPKEMIDTLEARLVRNGAKGYRLDLRKTDIRKADLSGLNFAQARFDGSRLELAILLKTQLQGAVFKAARMEGAKLSWSSMQGAVLWNARMEGADCGCAQLQAAVLWGARLEGASFNSTDLRSADWAGATLCSQAHSADLRGAQNLNQAQLNAILGDERTLLPEGKAPDTGQPYSIAAYWEEAPCHFEQVVAWMARDMIGGQDATIYWEIFLCGDKPVVRYSNSLPVDAPYPEGHPLAERN
ncbi:pentapeptide repeat-containing protein [Amaricoccus tamworthensis]|uniref:pentapeptide repeat-containing protein n=1 Tax=Amaricoccus tamworthensis TaxID=57002 RepID=UPI003C7C4F7C